MTTIKITSKDYDGVQCPMCKSTAIHHDDIRIVDDADVERPCKCTQCGAKWVEEFSVTGYNKLDGTKKPTHGKLVVWEGGQGERADPRTADRKMETLFGRLRLRALHDFKEGLATEGLTFWYVPPAGDSKRIVDPSEIDWRRLPPRESS